MRRTKSFDGKQPLLYLIATPIGNLKEISERAIEAFNDADLVACEDTRNTFSLLAKYGIKKDLYSLHEHNENEGSSHIISLLKEGKKVAYVSDAGYPGISDPGYLLVKNAIKEDIAVSTICGSSAFLNALVASGLETSHFYFHGFLPAKENEAKKELEPLAKKVETLIFYEAPHRIDKTLSTLLDVLGDRQATIGRELTKLNEEFIRGTLSELSKIDPSTLKGEMVIIVEGNKIEETISDKQILDRVGYVISLGVSKKTAAEIVSTELNINKNYVKKLIN